jgi:hypothetical protein
LKYFFLHELHLYLVRKVTNKGDEGIYVKLTDHHCVEGKVKVLSNRIQESGARSQNDKYWFKTLSLVDDTRVETFLKTPSLYAWCILNPEF